MDSFPELRNYCMSEMNSDITLVVEGHRLPAHKFVLSAKSPVFRAMFFGDLMESTAAEVEIKEAPIEPFKVMLRYLYSEEFALDNEIDLSMSIEVFRLGHRYQLSRLVTFIEQTIIKMLKKNTYVRICDPLTLSYEDFLVRRRIDTSLLVVIDNIARIYEFALLYDLPELMDSCQRFIAKNCKFIVKKGSFVGKSFAITESILDVIKTSQTNQSVLIYALQTLREVYPDSDLSQFERFVDFDNCSVDDINSVRTLRMFSNDKLIDILVDKYKSLETSKSLLKGRRA